MAKKKKVDMIPNPNFVIPQEFDWKLHHGDILPDGQLMVIEKCKVTRYTQLEIYEPRVWAIDTIYDKPNDDDDEGRAGPKDIELTEACKLFVKEVGKKKSTHLDRTKSMYKLVRAYERINGGKGDSFVREAFCPWLSKAGACARVDPAAIWNEVMN